MSARIAADLRATARVLRERGWTKFQHCDQQGRVCAVGALRVAVGVGPNNIPPHADGTYARYSAARDEADRAIATFGFGAFGLMWFSDNNESSVPVLCALERAATCANPPCAGFGAVRV